MPWSGRTLLFENSDRHMDGQWMHRLIFSLLFVSLMYMKSSCSAAMPHIHLIIWSPHYALTEVLSTVKADSPRLDYGYVSIVVCFQTASGSRTAISPD